MQFSHAISPRRRRMKCRNLALQRPRAGGIVVPAVSTFHSILVAFFRRALSIARPLYGQTPTRGTQNEISKYARPRITSERERKRVREGEGEEIRKEGWRLNIPSILILCDDNNETHTHTYLR